MSLTGGKRKANKSLMAWVKFVKKVQKEEKLNYKEAIHRAKVRKDKGEKWMVGGLGTPMDESMDAMASDVSMEETPSMDEVVVEEEMLGGRKRSKTMNKGRGRTQRRGRGRTQRRQRGRTQRRGRGRASRRY